MQWMSFIVSTLLLYGKGNAIVMPHTWSGLLQSLEPIAADRVQLLPRGASRREYDIYIDGIRRDPANVIHFVFNPDKYYPWKGAGINVPLRQIVQILKQARETEKQFMGSKCKPYDEFWYSRPIKNNEGKIENHMKIMVGNPPGHEPIEAPKELIDKLIKQAIEFGE
jgi:hypothetical protein